MESSWSDALASLALIIATDSRFPIYCLVDIYVSIKMRKHWLMNWQRRWFVTLVLAKMKILLEDQINWQCFNVLYEVCQIKNKNIKVQGLALSYGAYRSLSRFSWLYGKIDDKSEIVLKVWLQRMLWKLPKLVKIDNFYWQSVTILNWYRFPVDQELSISSKVVNQHWFKSLRCWGHSGIQSLDNIDGHRRFQNVVLSSPALSLKIWKEVVLRLGNSGYYCWRSTTPVSGCCFSRSFGRLGSAPTPRGHQPKQMENMRRKKPHKMFLLPPKVR